MSNKTSCDRACGPGDYYPGGLCDKNGCYTHRGEISEEALMAIGFTESDVNENTMHIVTGTLAVVYVNPDNGLCSAFFGHTETNFPGVATMTDLRTLIRFLGGGEK